MFERDSTYFCTLTMNHFFTFAHLMHLYFIQTAFLQFILFMFHISLSTLDTIFPNVLFYLRVSLNILPHCSEHLSLCQISQLLEISD